MLCFMRLDNILKFTVLEITFNFISRFVSTSRKRRNAKIPLIESSFLGKRAKSSELKKDALFIEISDINYEHREGV